MLSPLDVLYAGYVRTRDILEPYYHRKEKKRIKAQFESEPKYLNVGGGNFVREHWRVLDFDATSYWFDSEPIFLDFAVDLERQEQWPIDDSEYDLVYSSHTLEHISDEAVTRTLEEMYRVLKPGGWVRINVPDMNYIMEKYDQGAVSWFTEVWPHRYPQDTDHPGPDCPDGFELEFYLLVFFASHLVTKRRVELDYAAVREELAADDLSEAFQRYSGRIKDEWQRAEPRLHRNWFTPDRLRRLLKEAGFETIEQRDCNKSRIDEFCYPEFDNHELMSVFMDARKPD